MVSNGRLRDNPTPEQKAVYRFYKSRRSNDADNIYSTEWFSRIVKFQESSPLRKEKGDPLPWTRVDDLEFGPLFVLHPVPAFSLWLLLDVCYDLDRKVCGDASEKARMEWRSLKPCEYLTSDVVQFQWKKSLEGLKNRMQSEELGGEILLEELYDMVSSLRRMEAALGALRDSIRTARRDKPFLKELLEIVGLEVDNRCEIIAAEMEDSRSLGSEAVGRTGFLDATPRESSDFEIISHEVSQQPGMYSK
jgi:hypothetical protein